MLGKLGPVTMVPTEQEQLMGIGKLAGDEAFPLFTYPSPKLMLLIGLEVTGLPELSQSQFLLGSNI